MPATPRLEQLAPTAAQLSALLSDTDLDHASKGRHLAAALVSAASNGDADLLEWILSSTSPAHAHADALHQARDSEGAPPLVLATCFGHSDCVRICIEAGLDPNAVDSRNWTALHWAVQNADLPLTSYILNHGADSSIRSFKGLLPADLLRRGPESEMLRNVLGASAERSANQVRSGSTSVLSSASGSSSSSVSKVSTASNGSEASQKLARKRKDLAVESAHNLDVDLSLLSEAWQNGLPSPLPVSSLR